jgi:hypothetical protein
MSIKSARKVRIMLNKQDNLNIADVRVYGQGVNYSVLLNEEMSKNLLANETFTFGPYTIL